MVLNGLNYLEADFRSPNDYRLVARGRGRFDVAVDLGQRGDPTAIAVLERRAGAAMDGARRRVQVVRYLERVALGTPYPLVVAHLKELLERREIRGQCTLVVDGTGVGAPVVDMLRRAGLDCEITAVSITGGMREARQDGGRVTVPKRDLIAGLQLALENGELRIAGKLRERGALVRELMSVRMSAGMATGRVKFGADGRGEHDDLVIAVALAVWRGRRGEVGDRGQRLTGI